MARGGPARRALAPARGRASSPCTTGGSRVTSTARPGRRPAAWRPSSPRCEERLRAAVSGHAAEVGGARGRDPRGRRQAGAPAAGVLRRAPRGACRPGRARTCSRPRRRSSWCTWRRWCTTTCSTAPTMRRGPAHRGAGRSGPERGGQHRRLPVRPRVRRAHPHRLGPAPCRRWPPPPSTCRGARWTSSGAAFDLALTEEAYLARCRRKTAALFAVACRLGALVGGGRPRGRRSGWPPSARTWGWPSRSSTTSSTWRAAPAATGKRRGTDLVRRHGHPAGDPGAAARAGACAGRSPRAGSGRGVEALCDRLAAHAGRCAMARERALGFVAAARACDRGGPAGRAPTSRPCSRSPTAWWTGTRERLRRAHRRRCCRRATRSPPPAPRQLDPGAAP